MKQRTTIRKSVVICIAVLFSITAFGVGTYDLNKEWSRIFGSTAYDEGYAVSVDTAGNIYVTGHTFGSFDGQTNLGEDDVFLTKYDLFGSSLWVRIWGSDEDEAGSGVAADNAGNVYVAGTTRGSIDGEPHPETNSYDIFVTKCADNGDRQWTRLWGGTSSQFGLAADTDSQGNLYVAGYTTGPFGGQTNVNESEDACLMKISPSGSNLWTRIWGSHQADYGRAVGVDTKMNVYVSGHTQGSFDGQTNTGVNSLFVTKFNGAGDKQWTRIVSGMYGSFGDGICVDENGRVCAAGNTQGGPYDGEPDIGEMDLFLTSFTSSGSKEWTCRWGSTGAFSYAGDACADGANGSYVVGRTDGPFDGQTNSPPGHLFCLTKIDTAGERQWTYLWGPSGTWYNMAKGVTVDEAGSVYVVGSSDSPFDGETDIGDDDVFLTKFSVPEATWWWLIALAVMGRAVN